MARYDTSRRRWRHLDFGACKVWLEADIHRIDCRSCTRVRTEQVPWARPILTIVADHDTGNVVWVGKERSKAGFEDFFAALGPERSAAASTCLSPASKSRKHGSVSIRST